MTNALTIYERMSETEEWRDVPEYEGLYQVSDMGRISSAPRNGTTGGLLKPNVLKSGYLQVTLYKEDRLKKFKVHRIVMLAFVGQSKSPVNHINGEKADNRLVNLEYTTAKLNVLHAIKLRGGVWGPRGEQHGMAKLSTDDVSRIRSLKGKVSQRALASQYGISEAQMSRIMNNQRWNHD